MSLAAKLLSASGGGVDKLYVDDVFSSYVYQGNGSTQTITNGIDLAGKGGMVWTKDRNDVNGHSLFDTARGAGNRLVSSATTASVATGNEVTGFASSGYTVGNGSTVNQLAVNYVSWTFRKAPKFFDVVTYTGDGVAGRTIAHSLGQAPGMLIVKCTSAGSTSWTVYHRSTGASQYAYMGETGAFLSDAGMFWNNTAPTSSVFTVGWHGNVNTNGATYVAYLFAHDTSADGIIQCGSFTTDASGPVVNLGWEPQYLLLKTSSAVDNWVVLDASRGWTADGTFKGLAANTSSAEYNGSVIKPSATGFSLSGFGAGTTYIYLAIRRPNKPPTTGTQVYNAIARTGTGAAATVTGVGFAPDLAIYINRPHNFSAITGFGDKLRGSAAQLDSFSNGAEVSNPNCITSFGMDGFSVALDNAINRSGATYINHFFKRAPGVFDQVCYTGTGVAKTEAHGLGVVPELMIVRSRNYHGSNDWFVYAQSEGATKYLILQTTAATATNSGAWNNTTPTSSVFSLGGGLNQNVSGYTGVAYLFATKAGISKVFSYTGNGTSQTIDCGFATGARFVMIKATSTTGNWTVIDTTRGLVAGSDPYLALNTTAAEVTGEDCVDPTSSGFIVNTTAAALNTNGVSYLFLAFA